jgi:hypothetical protein
MNALNSVRGQRKTPYIAGIGVLAIAAVLVLLYVVPIFSTAAGITVTVSATSSYGHWVNISGTVSPAPEGSGYYAAIAVVNSNGQPVIDADALVNATTGAFSDNYTGVSNFANGTYSITVTYAQNVNEPYYGYGTLQYGAVTTSSTSSTSSTCSTCSTTTTVFYNVTTTVTAQTTTTVVESSAVTTTIVSAVTTTLVPVTTVISSITTVSSGASGVGTAEALGAVGIVIGIIAAVLAVMTMRKK